MCPTSSSRNSAWPPFSFCLYVCFVDVVHGRKLGEKLRCATQDSPFTIFCLPGVLKSSTPGVPTDGTLESRSQDAQHIYVD